MTRTADTYAQALFGLCREAHAEEETYDALRSVLGAMRGAEGYLQLLSSPAIPKRERLELLDRAFSKNTPDRVMGFLRVLIGHGQMRAFPECVDVFGALCDEANGITTATVKCAMPPTEAEMDTLRATLEKRIGKRVRIDCRVDGALLGGMRVEVDGHVFDGTLRRRLNDLKDVIKQ